MINKAEINDGDYVKWLINNLKVFAHQIDLSMQTWKGKT